MEVITHLQRTPHKSEVIRTFNFIFTLGLQSCAWSVTSNYRKRRNILRAHGVYQLLAILFCEWIVVTWRPKATIRPEEHKVFGMEVHCVWNVDGTRVETRFRLSAKRTSPFKSAEASVQSTTGSRGVRINGSNAGYNMFRDSVKGIDYPLHSPVSPLLPLSCVTVFHHISTGLYNGTCLKRNRGIMEPCICWNRVIWSSDDPYLQYLYQKETSCNGKIFRALVFPL